MTTSSTRERWNTTSSSGSSTSTTLETSSTTTRARACAREEERKEREREERVDLLAIEYRACVGPTTDYIRAQLRYWLDLTCEEVLTYAIHQTAMAPRPSWRYMLAILSRCQRQGVTARQAAADDALTCGGEAPLYQRGDM